ncbi:hypothetical protein MTO96_002810 [Rhipicephalus appendiculatus]
MVEEAKEADVGSCSTRNTIKHMRRTLERPTDHKTKSGSTEVRKSRQNLASKTDVSLKASAGSSDVRKSRKSLASSTDSSARSSTRRHGHKSSQKLGLPKSVSMSVTQADADIG